MSTSGSLDLLVKIKLVIHFAFLTGCFQGNFHEAEHWFKKAQVLNKSDHASWTHYGMFSSLQERSFIF